MPAVNTWVAAQSLHGAWAWAPVIVGVIVIGWIAVLELRERMKGGE